MTRAFIVRPFGVRNGIDFDRVDDELIAPVLERLHIAGRTTLEIARSGNIRTDMFERLLLADVVIADISIHNANVYYELGIRHALRDRTTILVRAAGDDVPFDLRTDRYLEYAAGEPGASRDQLARAVQESLAEKRADSPVFLLLPALKPTDPEELRPIPAGFTEEVEVARSKGDRPMLAVLFDEAAEFDWSLAGARIVGRAQFELSAWKDALETWESIRRRRPEDAEANVVLGTVLQRIGELAESSAALQRVLGQSRLPARERAEALALVGRNAKARWIAEWSDEAEQDERRARALRSGFLDEARRAYDEGFLADQNHWYSGINALALATITLHLAEQLPAVWAERFEEPEREAATLTDARAVLESAVRRALDAQEFRSERFGEELSEWLALTRADFGFLTSTRPRAVAALYQRAQARLGDQARFAGESAAAQIRLFLRLGVLVENARAALDALGVAEDPPPIPPTLRPRILVFSGHRIDAPGRETPRFPPDRAEQAAALIRAAVKTEQELAGSAPVEGLAGGASGGDTLFHEACAELGIATSLLLAIPRDEFVAASVADAGPDWVERFRRLDKRLSVSVLAESEQLPDWLAKRPDYSVWQRNNRWILHTALSRGDADVTLIVLWNGKGGDGPGGTEEMVQLAQARGLKVVTIDANQLIE